MKSLLCIIIAICVLAVFPNTALAVENPTAVANNKIGVHILFPSELEAAARLINSNGGDWGYVTIPIQAGDKDLEKWQKFLDDAKTLHVIPIIRLASEGDYFNTKVWRKPTYEDVLDFANFLSSLNWPVKNKYVIVFNEVNRGDEWGGGADPAEYARLLSYAVAAFKSKDQNFFILSSGLDNAAPDSPPLFYNEYTYLTDMNKAIPGIFYQIDGFSSHSYPNPSFLQPPSKQDRESIASFRFEKKLIESLGSKDLWVFITETGWSNAYVDDSEIANYYKDAFLDVWRDNDIVAVTPFLLMARAGPFTHFSLTTKNGEQSKQYDMIQSLEKIKGKPLLQEEILGVFAKEEKPKKNSSNLPTLSFHGKSEVQIPHVSVSPAFARFFKWLLKY